MKVSEARRLEIIKLNKILLEKSLRICTTCDNEQELFSFYSGTSVCKECRSKKDKEKYEKKFPETTNKTKLRNELEKQGFRVCGVCHLMKKLDENFGWLNKKKGERQYVCRDCRNKVDKASYEEKYKNDPILIRIPKKTKICPVCKIDKQLFDYAINNKTIDKKQGICKDCYKKWRDEHREEKALYDEEYRSKSKNKTRKKERHKKRIKNDPLYRFRRNVSGLVWLGLRRNKGGKNGQSFFIAIGYSPAILLQWLMIHPEKEDWMTLENQGMYNSDIWDDNDSSTWNWQLDHIKPHSLFKYLTMKDQEFKECWAISNLRPLSAKQNWIDGFTRTRHKPYENKV